MSFGHFVQARGLILGFATPFLHFRLLFYLYRTRYLSLRPFREARVPRTSLRHPLILLAPDVQVSVWLQVTAISPVSRSGYSKE